MNNLKPHNVMTHADEDYMKTSYWAAFKPLLIRETLYVHKEITWFIVVFYVHFLFHTICSTH